MDVCALAEVIVPTVVQEGAGQLGKAIVEKIVDLTCSGLSEVYQKLFRKYCDSPQEVSTLDRKDLNVQLARLFDKEPELAKAVEELLKQAGQEPVKQTIVQRGSGNHALQISGSHIHVSR